MAACQSIVGTIGFPNQSIALEITAQGLLVDGQNVDPHHRNVRLLHELLVPLNIACLEIKGSLTPDDLRLGIIVLQEHRNTLGQSKTFREIQFDDLPASIQAVSCNVLQQTRDQDESGDVSLDDLLDTWNDHEGASGKPKADSAAENLATQFMDMISRILANVENSGGLSHGKGAAASSGSFVTKEELVGLRESLQRLVDLNPDPEELTQLITQAQRALHLSQDANSVELAFSILKKDMGKKKAVKSPPRKQKTTKVEFKYTVAELLEAVAELEESPALVDEPWEASRTNQLIIGLQLLRSDPPFALRSGMIESVKSILIRPDFADHNLSICAQYFDFMLKEDGPAGLETLLPLVLDLLRKYRPDMMAPFWLNCLEQSQEKHLAQLWPFLINDILMGFEGVPRATVKKLVIAAGTISLAEAKTLEPQLTAQPAFRKKTASRDLFLAPLGSLYPVHTLLKNTSLGVWLGAELYRSMCAKPESPLMEVVMIALGEHHAQYLGFYLGLIRHQNNENPPPALRDLAVEILHGVLRSTNAETRKESWMPKAMAELFKLDPEGTVPLLHRVLNDRKFLILKAWPSASREAAASILKTYSPGGE